MVRASLAAIVALGFCATSQAHDYVQMSGQDLYERFCAACHGERGRGDGPVSESLTVETVKMQPDVTQEWHVDGLPLGTRGGMQFSHTFPVDAEYEIVIRLMRDRDEVRVVADQIGAPTWAGGLADVAWALGSRRLPGIWHFSDAGVASWYDFAVAIAEEATCLGLLERSPPIVPIGTAHHPTPATRPRFSLLDSSRTLSTLGLPAIHWRMNLRRMLAELRARREEEHAADRR